MVTTKTEIESLIYLLDDPDPEVQRHVQTRLDELGENAVPLLDQHRAESRNDVTRSTIRDIIHKLTFSSLYEEFSELLEEGMDSRLQLEKATFLLARFGNPTLRIGDYQKKLDLLARDIESEITYQPSGVKKMQTLLHYVFRELRFHGDDTDYYNPENAFLDRVIDKRKGLPISLSLIVIFLAHRLEMPFYGVNMPIHFMLVYEGAVRETLVDSFDGGTIVTYDQCHYFLKKNGIRPMPEHFRRTGEQEILARSIRNLVHSFRKAGRYEKSRDLQSLLQLVELKG